MKGKFGKLTWIAIVIVLITVGCSPSAALSTPNPTPTLALPTQLPARTATTAPSFPIGIFIKGGWTWEIKADGSYYSKSSMADESGVYTVTGNQVAIQGDFTPCKEVIGTYTWTYDGNVLTLTPVEDQCTDRREVVDGKWRKKP